jgi:hypothetical protein
MPLFRKPFFRASRGLWYLEIVRGKQVNLGRDRDAAFARYHGVATEIDVLANAANFSDGYEAPLVVKVIDGLGSPEFTIDGERGARRMRHASAANRCPVPPRFRESRAEALITFRATKNMPR